ncbi:MAG: LCP family protein [Patescibacteria group bacterium]
MNYSYMDDSYSKKYGYSALKNSDVSDNKRVNSDMSKKGYSKIIVITVILFVLLCVVWFSSETLKSLFNPVSVAQEFSTSQLSTTDGRVNVLLLGSDKRTVPLGSNELTDTILVASIDVHSGDAVLISLPRDLWVTHPNNYESKVNAVYALSGVDALSHVLEDVLGLKVHYYAVINFDLFTKVIDEMGGLDINVERSFTDSLYPIAGKEDAPLESDRYETVHFNAGVQKMDGATALKYVRSRKGDNGEGTDFARAKRQQNVISALKTKAFSMRTVFDPTKVIGLYKTYSENVDTNVDILAAQGFLALSQNVEPGSIKSIVLDDRSSSSEGGLLYAPEDTTLYGGAYVLVPRSGDYSQLRAYVQRFLFGE